MYTRIRAYPRTPAAHPRLVQRALDDCDCAVPRQTSLAWDLIREGQYCAPHFRTVHRLNRPSCMVSNEGPASCFIQTYKDTVANCVFPVAFACVAIPHINEILPCKFGFSGTTGRNVKHFRRRPML